MRRDANALWFAVLLAEEMRNLAETSLVWESFFLVGESGEREQKCPGNVS